MTGDGAASNEEFGRSIKFAMDYSPEEGDEDDFSSEEEEFTLNTNKKDIDLRYNAAAVIDSMAGDVDRGNKAGLEFGSAWMKEMIIKYFEGNDAALSLGLDELSTTIYDVLSSQRSDDELQTEVII